MRRFLTGWELVEKWVGIIVIALMAVLVIYDVVSREFFNEARPFAQKTSIFLMIWAGLLGAALTSARGKELKPEAAQKLWPRQKKVFLQRLSDGVTAVFCGLMLYGALAYVLESFEFSDTEIITGAPLWLIQLIFPYVFLSIGLRHLLFAIDPELRPKEDRLVEEGRS